MNFFDHHHFFLVGIKGVAMTSLAQLLLDAGKSVSGSDLPESFVTQNLLETLDITLSDSFEADIPVGTECVVYTAAHQGKFNPQVQQALARGIEVYSQAEALSFFFNQKKGIAVCGVGGKSSVSAMITWILEKTGRHPSFSVGVGNIPGLNKTGQWLRDQDYFVAEADEYVTDPAAIQRGEPAIPRFAYLNPFVTVCTHLKFDHPDVYRDETHTLTTFNAFFDRIKPGGVLIVNEADRSKITMSDKQLVSFGTNSAATMQYTFLESQSTEGVTLGVMTYKGVDYPIQLRIPGEYNLENAAAAVLATTQIGIPVDQAIQALVSFQSTSRRFEKIGTWNGVTLYDDYAHHPSEIAAVLKALYNWYPTKKCVVAFQPHTYSRTKSLFNEFAAVLGQAKDLVLLNIFASARESYDESISSELLAEAITTQSHQGVLVLDDYHQLADYCRSNLSQGDVLMTLGAGDIYKVHQLLLAND